MPRAMSAPLRERVVVTRYGHAGEAEPEVDSGELSPQMARNIRGLFAATAAAMVALALWSWNAHGSNLIGAVGALGGRVLIGLLGAAAWAVPLELAAASWRQFAGRVLPFGRARALAVVVPAGCGCVLCHLLMPEVQYRGVPGGGALGVWVGDAMAWCFGWVGALALCGFAMAVTLIARGGSALEKAAATVDAVALLGQSTAVRASHLDELPCLPPAPAPLPTQPITIVAPAVAGGAPVRGRVVELEAGHFEFPSTTLLALGRAVEPGFSRAEVQRTADALVAQLESHGVLGRIDEVHLGPVVTTYELAPRSGTKVAKVAGLDDDLALGLAVDKVRVVRGKGRVGVEVPNARRKTVTLRQLLETRAWQAHQGALPLALGVGTAGEPVIGELTQMPHLLVAGATGSGKSVGLNAMIASLLFRCSPSELRLVLLDPKVVEFGTYEGIPHLLTPVVTEVDRALRALQWVGNEMNRRYQLLASAGVRDLSAYNQRCDPLPRIVVVVDEFADLLLSAPREVEAATARVAQKARAAGIHLILATQRPSVDVITGTIKANFPARVAYKVSQREDSRTILGRSGAEHLLGQGDMLMIPPGSSELRRVHGALIDEEEVRSLCAFLRTQSPPAYVDVSCEEAGGANERDEAVAASPRDDLYERSLELISADGYCSVSHLQRRLGIGYNRAAKLVERMELDGVAGNRRGPGRPKRLQSNDIGSSRLRAL